MECAAPDNPRNEVGFHRTLKVGVLAERKNHPQVRKERKCGEDNMCSKGDGLPASLGAMLEACWKQARSRAKAC